MERDRLLSDEEIRARLDTDLETDRLYEGKYGVSSTFDVYPLLKAQRDLTSSIVRKETAQEIFGEIDIPVRYDHNKTCYDCIQALKAKYGV